MRCHCKHPVIKCDHRGCRCQLCGELRSSLGVLDDWIDEVRSEVTPSAAPAGFVWIDKPVHVKGGDYEYDGQLLCSFPKELGGPVRYIVRDANRRLFIHNAQQCGLE